MMEGSDASVRADVNFGFIEACCYPLHSINQLLIVTIRFGLKTKLPSKTPQDPLEGLEKT